MRLQLTPEEYWEWRTTIAEMRTAEEKFNSQTLNFKCLQREAELASLKAQKSVQAAQELVNRAQGEYGRFKARLEEILGYSLNNKIIDDKTFEIKDFTEEK